MLGEVEVRKLVAGGADQLVALFAAVLPDSPTASLEELDEPEAFLREPSSFVLGGLRQRCAGRPVLGPADAVAERTAHHLPPRAGCS